VTLSLTLAATGGCSSSSGANSGQGSSGGSGGAGPSAPTGSGGTTAPLAQSGGKSGAVADGTGGASSGGATGSGGTATGGATAGGSGGATSASGGAGGAAATSAGGRGAPGGGTAGAGAGGSQVGSGGAAGGGAVVVSTATNGKQTIMAPYLAPPEATRQAGVPQATLDKFVFSTSKIFPNTSRNVNIFIPAQYVAGTVVPFMVIQDGDEQLMSFKTDIVMENLIAQKRLPVMAAVFVHNPDNFGAERSLEYDCLDADYSNFVMNELLPEVVRRHPELNLTTDPNGRGAIGKSSGGPASVTLGWLHPELFRRILTLNGSFVNICKDGPGAGTYPALVMAADPKPLRVYMFSGSNDNNGFAAGNQALADALQAKGYAWRYVYGQGAMHANNFGASLMTEALLWTWAGYPL
jgi:enterochelin esterase family protein